MNLGLFQHDVSVLEDLAVHDLAILDHVLGRAPVAVNATGTAHIPGKPMNTAISSRASTTTTSSPTCT